VIVPNLALAVFASNVAVYGGDLQPPPPAAAASYVSEHERMCECMIRKRGVNVMRISVEASERCEEARPITLLHLPLWFRPALAHLPIPAKMGKIRQLRQTATVNLNDISS
jgi:hypothetical protein